MIKACLWGGWLAPGPQGTHTLLPASLPPLSLHPTPELLLGTSAFLALVTGQRGVQVRVHSYVFMHVHNSPPKDRQTNRHGHEWPQAPEAAGSGGEDSGQTPGRTSPASEAPRREEGY